ncbi:MAG: TonB-dependent vitamin B12 receptor [Luteibacter sp.]|uniref:TonB-dependent vitamin B12 receptor n=1 Tax=Luteibacter sp. TaxID=1886636 RepID=UPI0028075D4E|nr:TonB-dependent vitamin B12 receptor [Luteibacter sp.]MDQ7996560.1 TonB-dependent vitamin B12 receptor [Luteibacter sp.]MDQ8048461.1 TonB-dependent vitamin B12 receptor [Luteibacter sp.]
MSLRISTLAVAIAMACLVPAAAFADDTSTDLDKVVVTASRTEQTQAQVLSASTVIDRAGIERLQPRSLADLLRATPGVSIANNGGPGKSTSVFMRGTESDHVLVLIDGVKVGSATSGTAAFQDIPVDQIERIEIVRGPFSSLYGSDALGGVIQIFTRRPEGSFVPNFSIGGGSYDTLRGSAGFSGRGSNGWYAVEANHDQTDGINACRGRPSPGGGGCYTYEPDKDGYRNNALSLKGGWRFDEQWDADVNAMRTEGANHYDGTSSNFADSSTQVVGGRLRYTPSKDVKFTLNLGRSGDFSTDYENGVYADTFNTHRDVASVQADLGHVGGDAGQTTLGYDWQRDRVVGSTDYFVDARRNHAIFGQWLQAFGDSSIQASLRRDENSQFGGKTTGSLQYGYMLTKDLRVTGSYGTAFKAPTFNDLYYPDYGNPDLRPETSRNWELGLRGTPTWGNWSINAFQNHIDNLIVFDSSLTGPLFPFGGANNIDRARIRGVELAADTTVADWRLSGNATWLQPEDDSDDDSKGNLLPRRARRTANIDVDRSFGALSVGASVLASGYRYDDSTNLHRLGGYALTDLRIAYAFAPAWSVELAGKNVFDRHYETARYFNQLGRNYMLTFRYQPRS